MGINVTGLITGSNGTLTGQSRLEPGATPGAPGVPNDATSAIQQSPNMSDAAGRRVRLRAKPGALAQNMLYAAGGVMAPLRSTAGMVFPYQPLITYQQEVGYSTMDMVHANQDFLAYNKTPSLKLSVDGDFSVQNQKEGQYAYACIHFLRSVSKMWFGGQTVESKALAGTPPPVLLFDAYGQYMFNALPVVVTQFSVTLPKDVDYVPVDVEGRGTGASAPVANEFHNRVSRINDNYLSASGDGIAWLPTAFTIQVQLTVQNTPQRLRQFDMKEFNSGNLLKRGGWV